MDVISRQAAIDALEKDMASLDHIINGMSANDVRLDAYVSQRNQVNYDIYTINNLPPVQPEQLGTNLAEVGTERRMVNGYPIDADLLMMKVEEEYGDRARDRIYQIIRYMPKYEQPLIYSKLERLTDKEQRIFLAAMGRERKVCKEVDDQYTHEPYEVLLTKVCSEIERKVKKALWS